MRNRIEIWAEFGSDCQEESAMEALDVMLKSWTKFYGNSHKKNKIVVELSKHPTT